MIEEFDFLFAIAVYLILSYLYKLHHIEWSLLR